MFQLSHRSLSVLSSFLLLSFCLTGCGISKKPKNHWWQFWRTKPTASVTNPDNPWNEPPAPLAANGSGTSSEFGSMPAGGMSPLGIAQPDAIRAPFNISEDLQSVFFGFDEWHITETSASTLDGNVDWIISNPNFHVQIQGHTDERGTPEYNVNLGQLRADTVREYLVMSGIEPERLHSISYGEENPIAMGGGEQSFQENRRVEFLVYEAGAQ